MLLEQRPGTEWILLTGATGFVGQALLDELLRRGRRVLCLVRGATPDRARQRVIEALGGTAHDADALMETGRLAVLRADLLRPGLGLDGELIAAIRGRLEAVVHAAGNTVFDARYDGEPAGTNVGGTREVFGLAARCDCADWHFVSTAYVCGACDQATETLSDRPPSFRNEYEQSKWQAEQDAAEAARRSGATLTFYRPSIVVGESGTGRASRFAGVYFLFRATSLIAQYAGERDDIDRRSIPLRIRADGLAHSNLICIDDLRRAFGELFDNPQSRGGIYHLTHPDPPTNEQIKRAIEARYDIGGGRFVGRRALSPDNGRSRTEEVFDDMTASLGTYLFDAPRFDRRRIDRFVTRRPAPWNEARLIRLMDYAESVGWRPNCRPCEAAENPGGCAAYFERFLPQRIPLSRVSRIRKLEIDARFIIEDEPAGDWWCRFRDGQLAEIARASERPAEVVYRTDRAAFWRAVSGTSSSAELFLTNQARIEGDLERGMKLAMILQEFVQEFPWPRGTLSQDGPAPA